MLPFRCWRLAGILSGAWVRGWIGPISALPLQVAAALLPIALLPIALLPLQQLDGGGHDLGFKVFDVLLIDPIRSLQAPLHVDQLALAKVIRRKFSQPAPDDDIVPVGFFLAVALLNTLGLIPTLHFPVVEFLSGTTQQVSVSIASVFKQGGKILLTLALAAIGLEVNLRQLAGVGAKAMMAGLGATVVVGAASLLLIKLLL